MEDVHPSLMPTWISKADEDNVIRLYRAFVEEWSKAQVIISLPKAWEVHRDPQRDMCGMKVEWVTLKSIYTACRRREWCSFALSPYASYLQVKWWYLSSHRMTVAVETNEQLAITDGAPIVRKFIGQPLLNLESWMKKQGGFVKSAINCCMECPAFGESLCAIDEERMFRDMEKAEKKVFDIGQVSDDELLELCEIGHCVKQLKCDFEVFQHATGEWAVELAERDGELMRQFWTGKTKVEALRKAVAEGVWE